MGHNVSRNESRGEFFGDFGIGFVSECVFDPFKTRRGRSVRLRLCVLK